MSLSRTDGPPGPTPATTHLVVGYDEHRGRAALTHAIALAARLDAHLHVVHVVDTYDTPVDPDTDDWEQRTGARAEAERAHACAELAALPGNWSFYTAHGDPARILAAIADDHDAAMIVIGAPRPGLAALVERLVGASVSTRLVHHGHRPVLVVPGTD
ncbi:universal stress protein [Nocardia thailandica]|uniref:Universal stress protein n=1 Tax=Nocardia thailandica TaxID=257275 RepID=A0ABW6PRW4_9NOCA